MRKATIVLAAVLVAALSTGTALAFCATEIDINYFNSSGCWQGEEYQGYIYSNCHPSLIGGTTSGATYKHYQSWDTTTGEPLQDKWYQWNGSGWTEISDPGLPGC